MLEPKLQVIQGGFEVGGIARSKKLGKEAIAAVETLTRVIALFLEFADLRANGLAGFEKRGMSLDGVRMGRVMAEGNARFTEKFLKERVHSLEAVEVSSVVAQEDIVLEEEIVVFPAVEENQAIFAKLEI